MPDFRDACVAKTKVPAFLRREAQRPANELSQRPPMRNHQHILPGMSRPDFCQDHPDAGIHIHQRFPAMRCGIQIAPPPTRCFRPILRINLGECQPGPLTIVQLAQAWVGGDLPVGGLLAVVLTGMPNPEKPYSRMVSTKYTLT